MDSALPDFNDFFKTTRDFATFQKLICEQFGMVAQDSLDFMLPDPRRQRKNPTLDKVIVENIHITSVTLACLPVYKFDSLPS